LVLYLHGAAMNRLPAIFALTLVTTGAVGFCQAEDPLFSRVPQGSVFNTDAATVTPENRGGTPERAEKVLKISQLADLLRGAGLEPETSSDETTTTVKLQHSRWTFPVVMALSEDRNLVQMVLLLSELKEKKLPPEKLLGIISANRDFQPVTFGFSEKSQRLELLVSLDNVRVSPSMLRAELRRLTTIAENTAALWEHDAAATAPAAAPPAAVPGNVGTQPAQSAPAQQQPAQQPAIAQQAPAQTAPSLIGKWSAARSAKEAFAMALNTDNSFVLVHVKDGKQTRSTGKFTLSGSRLTLTITEGGKLTASISSITASSFDFVPASGTKLTFKKAS
jgi:hypothetical protein